MNAWAGLLVGLPRLSISDHRPYNSAHEDGPNQAEQVKIDVLTEQALEPRGSEHLDTNDPEDQRERVLHVPELVDHAGEREVQRPESQDRKYVAREHEKRIGRDREDRRDGVDRE